MRRLSLPIEIPVLALALLGLGDVPLHAQTPPVFYACYVPLTGSVYRIKTADTKPACSSTSHIEFSWTDGINALRSGDAAGGDLSSSYPNPNVVGLRGRALSSTAPTSGQVLTFDGTSWAPAAPPAGGGGVTDHGALGGLTDDDHPQYLLGDGVRNFLDGFAVSGTVGSGALAASGAGTRMVWYPRKAAFRVGSVTGTHWDDAAIGDYSMALGFNTRAPGNRAVALGDNAAAIADNTTAVGKNITVNASGTFGFHANASATTSLSLSGTNQFYVLASGGVFMRTSIFSGCSMLAGSGSWDCTSDEAAKADFASVDGETVLAKIATLPIRSWRYQEEPSGARHVGPTAQDFRAAFGLGAGDKTISLVDADGVNLLAVQALERRTTEQGRAIDRLQAENAELRLRLERLEAVVAR